MEDSKMSY